MLSQLMFGCYGTTMQLGWHMAPVTLLVGSAICAAILGPHVSPPGQPGAPEIATATFSSIVCALYTVAFVYTNIWDRWESRFDQMPWSDSCLAGKNETGRRASVYKGAPCPFTGMPPSMRCPVCKAAVHESAFHHIEKKTTFVVGETVLKWDMATAALQKQQNATLARIELDEALDFNGNIIFGAIGNACIGCTAWQRSFNVMARWSLTMACMSQWFCWAPWAFQESIATVHNGKSLQWVLLVNSIFCAVFAAAVEARRLLLAVAFQTQYGDRINFPRALTAPTHGIRRTFVHWFAGPKAWTNVQPLEQADA